jgi:hypothetical protein
MTAVPPPDDLTVPQLGPLGAELGSGAQAKVYDLPALTLSDMPGPLVYKRYRPGARARHAQDHRFANTVAD